MEYEIDDEPQGLPDQPDGDRDGGLQARRLIFRKGVRPGREDLHDESDALRQLGEVA